MFSLHTPHGAVDIFLSVAGLDDWAAARKRALQERTVSNVEYFGLSDYDMLQCQLALEPGAKKKERIRVLRENLGM